MDPCVDELDDIGEVKGLLLLLRVRGVEGEGLSSFQAAIGEVDSRR